MRWNVKNLLVTAILDWKLDESIDQGNGMLLKHIIELNVEGKSSGGTQVQKWRQEGGAISVPVSC